MKLPNGQHAIVEDAKLLDYVLNPGHPVGRHHALLFRNLLGITRKNHYILRDALLASAGDHEVEPGAASDYGRKYKMRLDLKGPNGTKVVLAVWIVEPKRAQPRLITCYVE